MQLHDFILTETWHLKRSPVDGPSVSADKELIYKELPLKKIHLMDLYSIYKRLWMMLVGWGLSVCKWRPCVIKRSVVMNFEASVWHLPNIPCDGKQGWMASGELSIITVDDYHLSLCWVKDVSACCGICHTAGFWGGDPGRVQSKSTKKMAVICLQLMHKTSFIKTLIQV